MDQMFSRMDQMKTNQLSHVDNNHQGTRGKCTIPSFSGFYDGEKYFDWEMAVEQEFNFHFVPEPHRLRQATSAFKDFAIIWRNALAIQDALPGTWEQLKIAMRDRFVPPSYRRDLNKKLMNLEQADMSVQKYYVEFQKYSIRCGIAEDTEDKIVHFYGGLRHEIQDIVYPKEFYTVNRLFEFAMLAERELQVSQHRKKSNIDDNLTNQVLESVEQAFVKVDTRISRREAAYVATTSSSPSTSTKVSGKILNPAEIALPDRESTTTENQELDIKYDNHQIAKGDDHVPNLSTTHAIIEPYLLSTKSDLPWSQHNCLANLCNKEELCDSAMIIPVPQLVNETDSCVSEQNACAENKHLFSIATEKDDLKLLSSLNTLGYIQFDTLCALNNLKEKFVCVELPWLYRCTYHFVGKYNCKGDYMVHRVYICSNLNSHFAMQ